MTKLPSKPTLRVREALEELLQRHEQTQGREIGEMFLGPDIFVALLRRPQNVLEGEWETTERTVDLLDLMEIFNESAAHREELRAGRPAQSDDQPTLRKP